MINNLLSLARAVSLQFRSFLFACIRTSTLHHFSYRFPLVSGFYKLLTGVVQVCEKAEYFTPRHEEHNSSDAALLFVERTEFIVLLQKFVVEVCLVLQMFTIGRW